MTSSSIVRKDGVRCDGIIEEGRRRGEECGALLLAKDSPEAPLMMQCPRRQCKEPHSILVLLSKAMERGDVSGEEPFLLLNSDKKLTEEDMSQQDDEEREKEKMPRRTRSYVSFEERLKPSFSARLGSARWVFSKAPTNKKSKAEEGSNLLEEEKFFIEDLVNKTNSGELTWWVGNDVGYYETVYKGTVAVIGWDIRDKRGPSWWILCRNQSFQIKITGQGLYRSSEKNQLLQHLYATIVEQLHGTYELLVLLPRNTNQRDIKDAETMERRVALRSILND